MRPSHFFNGRQVLVTGASRGIGKMVCERLAENGARVIAVARSATDLDDLVRALAGNGHKSIALDVVDESSWSVLAGLVEPETLHGVVCAAARLAPIGPIESIAVEEFRATLDVNVVGTLLAITSALPLFASSGASVVTFSGGGATAPFPRFNAYASSKAAVARLTENLAIELAERQVRVNAVAPGFIVSDMHNATIDAGPELVGADYFERTRIAIETGGGDSPERAVDLVEFLLSDASIGISGKLLSAKWDPWESEGFLDRLRSDEDLATIRRIDAQQFDSMRAHRA